jgi:hypothetical protein
MRFTPTACAFALALLAGCGASSAFYSPAATEACLLKAGATVDRADADALAAGANGYLVTLNGKSLNVAFGHDGDESAAILDAYEAAGGNTALYRKGNAVLSWDDAPGDDRQTVDGCLSSG